VGDNAQWALEALKVLQEETARPRTYSQAELTATLAAERVPIEKALIAFALDVLTERDDDGEEHAMSAQAVAWAERRGLVVRRAFVPEVRALLEVHTTTPPEAQP
jgi:hypothetical protein